MERQLPKNVRQIGNVSDNPKIYVEDYVDTYLNQLREKAREQPVGVILTGELLKLEDENAVFVSGAVQMKEVKTNGNDIEITDEIMKEAKEEAARFFPECRIVGWGIIEDGSPMSRNREVKRIQEKEFAEEWNLFLWKNAREQEEVFYAYKFGEITDEEIEIFRMRSRGFSVVKISMKMAELHDQYKKRERGDSQ